MPFRRNLSPIQTEKHEISWSNLAQNASATQAITIANGVVASAKNTDVEVLIGSNVNWVYFEFHFSAQVTTNPKVIHWIIEKLGATESGLTPSLYHQTARNHILKRGMEMLPSDQSTVFKRIFTVRIPRGYRRIGEGEFIQFRYICSSTETINACGIAIYKEVK